MIPIYSYLYSKGHCINCGEKIPINEFISELFGLIVGVYSGMILIFIQPFFDAMYFVVFIHLLLFTVICDMYDTELTWWGIILQLLLGIYYCIIKNGASTLWAYYGAIIFIGYIVLNKIVSKSTGQVLGDGDAFVSSAIAFVFPFYNFIYAAFISILALYVDYLIEKKTNKRLFTVGNAMIKTPYYLLMFIIATIIQYKFKFLYDY